MSRWADLVRQPLLVHINSSIASDVNDIASGPAVVFAMSLTGNNIERALLYNALSITGTQFIFLMGNEAWADASDITSYYEFGLTGALFDVGISTRLESSVFGTGSLTVYYKRPRP